MDVELAWRAGETFRIPIEWVEPDGTTPVNITGSTPRIHFRRTNVEPLPAIDLSLGDGMSVHGQIGRVLATVDPAKSIGRIGTYTFDVRLEMANGDVYFLFGGKARIERPVTDLDSGGVPPVTDGVVSFIDFLADDGSVVRVRVVTDQGVKTLEILPQ